jgi:microcystin-dependent protein
MFDYGGGTPPSGYLPCNGAAVSRTTYAALYAVLGDSWGPGNGSTTFNLPDCRGRAPRAADTMNGNGVTGAAGNDAGSRTALFVGGATSGVGSYQADSTKDPGLSLGSSLGTHDHSYQIPINYSSAEDEPGPSFPTSTGATSTSGVNLSHNHSLSGWNTESRGKNYAVYKMIKY